MIKKVQVASLLKDAAQTCLDAEIANISMYENFLLTKNLPDDIRSVFERLKMASESHIKAFKRQL